MPILNASGAPATAQFYPRLIENGIRFNDDDSPRLSWTPGGAADSRKTWTISLWYKRSNIVTSATLLGWGSTANDRGHITIVDEYLTFGARVGGSWVCDLSTTQDFRDPTGWTHIVWAYDSTPAAPGASDCYMAINGVNATAFQVETYPSQDDLTGWGNTIPHYIGCKDVGAGVQNFWDGYISEVIYCDGTKYAAADFGETKSGYWVPKEDISGLTYGTNGFYLDFAVAPGTGNGAGTDVSGNGNHFTDSGLAATDKITDNPTNNFAVFNPLTEQNNGTLSEGNCKFVGAANHNMPRVTIPFDPEDASGFEIEYKVTALAGAVYIGVVKSTETRSLNHYCGEYDDSYAYYATSGNKVNGASAVAYGNAFTTGDIIGVVVKNGKIYFKKNGVVQNSGDVSAETGEAYSGLTGLFNFTFSCSNGGDTVEVNAGNPSYSIASGNSDAKGYGNQEYAFETGTKCLCTQNLYNPADDDLPIDCSEVNHVGTRLSVSKAVTGRGTAQHSTADPKFGTSAILLDGNSDWLDTPDHADWDIQTNMTIACWVQHDVHTGGETYIAQREDGDNMWALKHSAGSGVWFYVRSGAAYIVSTSPAGEITDTDWHHVAMVKIGSEYGIFVDGDQVGYVDDASTDTFASLLYMGDSGSNSTDWLDGQMDDILITHDNYYSATIESDNSGSFVLPTARITSRTSAVKLLVQSVNAPDTNTSFGDTDFVTGVNFDPSAGSLVVAKNRDQADGWGVHNTVRGVREMSWFDDTGAETEYANGLMSFLPDGVAYGTNSYVGVAGENYLDIFWRLGVDYGAVVGTFEGTGVAHAETHGAGAVPKEMWLKNLDGAYGWGNYHHLAASDPETDTGQINTNGAFSDDATFWNDVVPTSTQLTVGTAVNVNESGSTIQYILWFDTPYTVSFAYKGNGNADGPFIPLPFKPWIWYVKQVGVNNWFTQNIAVSTYNPVEDRLWFDEPSVEDNGVIGMDVCANGLKLRGGSNLNTYNASGQLFIGRAWAKELGKFALAA